MECEVILRTHNLFLERYVVEKYKVGVIDRVITYFTSMSVSDGKCVAPCGVAKVAGHVHGSVLVASDHRQRVDLQHEPACVGVEVGVALVCAALVVGLAVRPSNDTVVELEAMPAKRV